jgi:DNA replication protein DnaC
MYKTLDEILTVPSTGEVISKNNMRMIKSETRIKNVIPELTYDAKASFIKIYKNEIKEKLAISESLKSAMRKLSTYFLGISGDMDLNKGIYLEGNYGVGKTILMTCFQKWIFQYFKSSGNGFSITSSEEIIDHYKIHGNLDHFIMNHEDYGYNKPGHLLINEFGKDLKDKIYGTNANQIINSLMMRRYELFQAYGKLTHVTSNYSPFSEEEALNDRYVEMFNFIKIEGKSLRK